MILRTLLYVPANSWRMINTAATEVQDGVLIDIEDACPIAEKETGRIFARDSVSLFKEKGYDVFTRVNAFETELLEEDLKYVVTNGLDGIMLPKSETAEDIKKLEKLLEAEEKKKKLDAKSVKIIALIESPLGVANVSEIIAASDRVVGVGFGAGDYSREIGAGMGVSKLSPEELFVMSHYPKAKIALAARAAGIEAFDTPFAGMVIDTKGLVDQTWKAKLMGFTGKQLVHPRHVEPVNAVFTPAEDDLKFAKQVIELYEEAKAKGLGATTFGGRMIDFGSYKRAMNLLKNAELIEEKVKARS
ncbi:HpcH/HpaI aldolase/citrate lyase family protein [Spirochaetota bacterium]